MSISYDMSHMFDMLLGKQLHTLHINLLCYLEREIKVMIDPTHLEESKEHFAWIVAYDETTPELGKNGPLFKVVQCVNITE